MDERDVAEIASCSRLAESVRRHRNEQEQPAFEDGRPESALRP